MIIARSLGDIPDSVKPTAVSIGVFDGMHTGHQMIMREVIRKASESNATPGVVTFDRHPLELIAPGKEPALITTVPQRAEAMQQIGLGLLLILKFDQELRSLKAEEFVQKILVESLDTSALSAYPLITVSRLLKSCAMPLASCPTLSIFCAWRN